MKLEESADAGFSYYQNANAAAEAVKTGFLVRQYEYGVIFDDLLRYSHEGSVQHYLLLGRRGSGKSTLLRRLQIEIDTNEELSNNYISINLAEEQANIYRLFDLLEEIVRELESRGYEVEWPEDDNADDYTRKLFSSIRQVVEKTGKRLVLLLDNIDRIFESLGNEASLLREYLQNYGDIKIIGGSTRMTEHFWAYDTPFYEFFRVLHLKPLDSSEIKALLLFWSEKLQAPQLRDFVENRPGQLETIRILTDGLPRTLQFFVNILLTHDQETGYDYLRLLMDKVTPLYQERLNNLPPSQRKIVLQMAFLWEAAGAKELALATRMENRVVSAQLSQLIDKGVAEKVETKTKNHLYRLSERFFNLWLIFTQGNPREKRKARYLSVFLENFYEQEEMREMALNHLANLMGKSIAPGKAYLLTKAFSQSKYTSSALRDSLIDATLQMKDIRDEFKMELPDTITQIIEEFDKLVQKEDWNKAKRLISSIEQEDGIKELLEGFIYWGCKDFNSAEKSLLMAYKKNFVLAPGLLASFYERLERIEESEKFLQIAENDKLNAVPHDLCSFYYRRNIKKSECISLIKLIDQEKRDEKTLALLPVLKVWNGEFKGVEEDIQRLIIDENPELAFSLTQLLVHHQMELVNKFFSSEKFGNALTDRFLILHYATQLLISNNYLYSIKIPPEINSTLNGLMLDIYKKRDYYYGTNEAKVFESKFNLAIDK